MAEYVNKSGGVLILPGGAEIASGATAEIGRDLTENVGVAKWIKDGWLVEAKAKADDKSKDKK